MSTNLEAQQFLSEFGRYRSLAEKSIAQLTDEQINQQPYARANSIGMLVRHISGNLRSRFTDFLTSDGEKPWRHRDEEFAEQAYSREEIDRMWETGWQVLVDNVSALSSDDFERSVSIRGISLTVREALLRSLAHVSYHVGQIVLLARMHREEEWEWLSVAPGASEAYNENPNKEKHP